MKRRLLELMACPWCGKDFDWESFDRSVDVLVSRLRQKLRDDPKSPSFIKTIWGHGYSFVDGGDDV